MIIGPWYNRLERSLPGDGKGIDLELAGTTPGSASGSATCHFP